MENKEVHMNTIVQRTADTIIDGIERNFRLPESKRTAFAVKMLNEILSERGLELNSEELSQAVKWAQWRRKWSAFCLLHHLTNLVVFLRGSASGSPPRFSCYGRRVLSLHSV